MISVAGSPPARSIVDLGTWRPAPTRPVVEHRECRASGFPGRFGVDRVNAPHLGAFGLPEPCPALLQVPPTSETNAFLTAIAALVYSRPRIEYVAVLLAEPLLGRTGKHQQGINREAPGRGHGKRGFGVKRDTTAGRALSRARNPVALRPPSSRPTFSVSRSPQLLFTLRRVTRPPTPASAPPTPSSFGLSGERRRPNPHSRTRTATETRDEHDAQ